MIRQLLLLLLELGSHFFVVIRSVVSFSLEQPHSGLLPLRHVERSPCNLCLFVDKFQSLVTFDTQSISVST